MGKNWREQPRDRHGRWYTDKKRDIRLDLRLSTSAADTLILKAERAGMTKTALIEAALRAFEGVKPPPKPPSDDIFAKHRAQLRRRSMGRR